MADNVQLKNIVEAALLAAGKALNLDQLLLLFEEDGQPDRKQLREALAELADDYTGRGIEVVEVASGWRIQVRSECASWVSRLWEEKPGRYSRALMETLALIAYRQPITRGEIEDIRGVSVSSNIVRTLLEREWVRVVGQRDVPGKPSLYGTTRNFLDYFNLKGLDDLPTLAEIRDLDEINRELELDDPDRPQPPDTDEASPQPPDSGDVQALAEAAGHALAGEDGMPVDAENGVDAATDEEEGEFDDLLPEFESDWEDFDDTVPADSIMAGGQDSGWADELAEELEDELARSELRSERDIGILPDSDSDSDGDTPDEGETASGDREDERHG